MNTAVAGKPRLWTYQDLCDLCREVSAEIDERRWIVGDTALVIEAEYGGHTADDFAREIGCNGSTVRNWKRVAKFYAQPFRAEQIALNPNLTYTYFRDALRLGNDLNKVAEWLAYVSIHGWSADEAARKLTERLGHQTRESYQGTLLDWKFRDGKYYATIRFDSDFNIEYNQTITIRVK